MPSKRLPKDRSLIKFDTPLSKEVHKIVSSLRYHEMYPFDASTFDSAMKEELVNLVKLSAYYNNMDVGCKWAKNKTVLNITVEI